MIHHKAYIILATYNPDLGFLKKQLSSISGQSHTNWRCIITDDGSKEEIVASIKQLIKDDERFSFRKNKNRVGVFHNFETGLSQLKEETDFIFYSDQDDVWKKDKMEKCIAAFQEDRSIMLVHSDMEMINENDLKIHSSCFAFESRDLSDFSVEQLVIKNSITGCTICFRKELLEFILPFPPLGKNPIYHHDLWTAMNAAVIGKIKVIKEPLIEYRQHSRNVVGAVQLNWKQKISKLRSIDEWRVRSKIIRDLLNSFDQKGAHAYTKIKIAKWVRRTPINFSMLSHSLKMITKGKPDTMIGIKVVIGKGQEFTMGLIRRSFGILKPLKKVGVLFRTIRELFKKDFRKQFKNAIGPILKNNTNIHKQSKFWYHESGVEEIVTDIFSVQLSSIEEPAINIVLPNFKPEHIFGGVSTAIRMGVSLVRLGHKIRFISSDVSIAEKEPEVIRELLKKRFQVTDLEMNRIFLADGSSQDKIITGVSTLDIFVATFWPTAYKIENTLQKYSFLNKRFLYLIQDYEPGFYNWSDDYALVESTYRMNYVGIYNTSLLADYFKGHNHSTINKDLVLQPEIEWSRYSPPSATDIQQRTKKRIVVYGRPNTSRNLFRTVVTSLRFWIQMDNINNDQVEILSAGEAHIPVELGNEIEMKSVGKLTMAEYAELLRKSDMGLSLMLSPHPSYPPFDMAASGMIVVTNAYENKHLDLSPNFVSTYANPRAIANAISENWGKLDDAETRIKGSVYSISELGFTMDHVTNEISKILHKEMGWENSVKKNEVIR